MTAAEHRRWLARAAERDVELSPVDRLRLLTERTTALLLLGEQEGWDVAAELLQTPAGGRERELVCVGLLNTAEAAMLWGRYADAGHRLARAAELAARDGHDVYLLPLRALAARLDVLTGQWDGLAGRARQLRGESSAVPDVALGADLVLALMSAADGADGAAEPLLGSVMADRLRRGELPLTAEPSAALSRLLLRAGRVQDALAATEQPAALIIRKGTWLWGTDLIPARVEALLAAGAPQQATELASAFAAGLRGRDLPAPKAGLGLCRAMLAQDCGEHGQAAALFGRAAAAWSRLPRPYDALLAQERQALCQIAAGRAGPGRALLGLVCDGLAGLGARHDAERAGAQLRRGGAGRPGRPGYGSQLSPRELEVVQLLVAGRTRSQIASALFRSPKTVDAQLSSAMAKLGASSRAALAARAVQAGIRADAGLGA